MRTYICLYLISPMINSYLANASKSQYLFILIALGIISVHIGSQTELDLSLKFGKNLTNFMFCYILGNAVRRYECIWQKIPVPLLISLFLVYNAFTVVFYWLLDGKGLAATMYYYTFNYNSPGLIISALLFFMIILQKPFKSRAVNWLASSALAIYLIHESRLVETYVLGPMSLSIRDYMGSDLMTLPVIVILALIVCIVCILIDKLLSPLWRWFMRLGERTEAQLLLLAERIDNKLK